MTDDTIKAEIKRLFILLADNCKQDVVEMYLVRKRSMNNFDCKINYIEKVK